MSSTVNPSQKQRLDWIDQTKGLAILGIIFFHFFQNYPDKLPLVSILGRNGAKIGYAAVDLTPAIFSLLRLKSIIYRKLPQTGNLGS